MACVGISRLRASDSLVDLHAGPDQFYNVRHASGYDAPIPYVQRNGDVEDHPRAPVNGGVNIYLCLGDEPISRGREEQHTATPRVRLANLPL